MLESDYWNYAKLTFKEPQQTLESIATHNGVPARETAVYPAMDVIDDIPKMTAAAHLACLDYALKDIDTASAHAAAAAQAWAVGDVAGIKANYLETRLGRLPAAERRLCQAARDGEPRHDERDPGGAEEARQILRGDADGASFLRKGGVLERLEAAGLTVSGPGG